MIPKVNSPLGLNDFRPISLIGCMYKVLSKVLAVRLKKVLSKVISEDQFAFLGGRNMLDSVVVVNEMIHAAKKRKKPTLIFKVDYEKAYDSVSWEFLAYMMRRMHFCRKWIQWIMSCLKSSSVSVLVNGSPCEEFMMTKGLRQGDPLAPFLFLIVAEGLNSLFSKAVSMGRFKGFSFGGDPDINISILQFADDTVFVGEATIQNVQTIKCILRCFELISGLKVNFHKSKLAGVVVDRECLGRFASILHCKLMTIPFVYLGIPVGGRLKSLALWEPVIKKMRGRLSLWKQKHISFGGRVCLIQSVLSALPLFFLSFYKIPVGVLTICTGIMRRFLWGGTEADNKISWVKWSEVSKPKAYGGLGIKDWRLFNMALLGKWNWRYINEPDSLWCRVVKANCRLNGESSWWKDIQSITVENGLPWFKESLQKTVLEGNDTQFWVENWTGAGCLELRFRRLYNLSCQKREYVKNMGTWVNGVWQWKFRWRRGLQGRELGWLEELMTILQGVRLEENKRDRWMWKLEGEGLYSVNSAYVLLQEQYLEDPDPVFTWIWEAPAPSNIKAFAWRMLLGRIQTRDNLLKRQILHIAEEAVCPLCGVVEESCAHLLFSCPETLSIWYACSDWLGVLTAQVPEPKAHLLQFPSVGRSKAQKLGEIAIWLATIWTIWCQRNKVVFNGGSLVREQVVEHIKVTVWQWLRTRLADFSYSWFEWQSNPRICLLSL